jgi:hypothetical protein
VTKKPKTAVQHQHILLRAKQLAGIYRGLAGELVHTAQALERAERPEDPYPAVSAHQFIYAMQHAAVLHSIVDQVLAQRSATTLKRK